MSQAKRGLLAITLAAALVAGCKERALVVEHGGGVQAGMPAAHGRMVSLEPADGIIEHSDASNHWRTKLSWDRIRARVPSPMKRRCRPWASRTPS